MSMNSMDDMNGTVTSGTESGLPISREIPDNPEPTPDVNAFEAAANASDEEKMTVLTDGADLLESIAQAGAATRAAEDPSRMMSNTPPGIKENIPTPVPPKPPVIEPQSTNGPVKVPNVEIPDDTPNAGGRRILTMEEAAQLGIDTNQGEIVDPEKAMEENMAKEDAARQKAEDDEINMMASQVLKDEADRMKRLENTLALPDDDPRKKELLGDRKAASVKSVTVTQKERDKDDRNIGIPGYDEEDLLPAYTAEEVEAEQKNPEAEKPEPPAPDEDAYAEYVRGLEVTDVVPAKEDTVIMLRDPLVEEIIEDTSKKYKNPQVLGDQAFMNAITRFKQDRYGKVTVPLINSGFMIDMVGTGVVDLQQLYVNVSEDTKVYEYQMEQMRTIIRNVTGTHPKIDPVELRNKIHYKDFPMMAFAHLCATLKTVESIVNCDKCSAAFRVTTRPKELLLNGAEINERAAQIAAAPNIETHSLMTKYKMVTTSGGFVITLGHPSYANEMTTLNSFLAYYNNMTPSDQFRFQNRLDVLYFIRKIQLPNGIVTNSILQNYLALGMINTRDLQTIQSEVAKMKTDIIEPKFGIREVVCPVCGNVIKNVSYRDILNLVFLHFQLDSYLHPAQTGTVIG